MLIFKIVRRAEWEASVKAGRYDGSAHDARDGFLHFSTAKQLMGTLEKHYAGADNLVLVAIEDDTLGPALKWEPSRGGDLFPHLYAPLSLGHVRWSADIGRDAEGKFLLPLDIGESP